MTRRGRPLCMKRVNIYSKARTRAHQGEAPDSHLEDRGMGRVIRRCGEGFTTTKGGKTTRTGGINHKKMGEASGTVRGDGIGGRWRSRTKEGDGG